MTDCSTTKIDPVRKDISNKLATEHFYIVAAYKKNTLKLT